MAHHVPGHNGGPVAFCNKSLTDAESKEYSYDCTVVAIGVTEYPESSKYLILSDLWSKGEERTYYPRPRIMMALQSHFVVNYRLMLRAMNMVPFN